MRILRGKLTKLPFNVEESLNRLRVNVRFTDSDVHTIMITSSVPNECKTFTSFQLFRMLAEAGMKTCFLDLDLRNSVIVSRYNLRCDDGKPLVGVDYYLSGQAELEEVIYSTGAKNADIVPVSHLLENPSILLESNRCRELIRILSERYRYVIVDTPPLVNVSDAALIASYCDGAMLVVRAGHTSKKAIKHSLNQLELSGTKLLGAVLSRTEKPTKVYGKKAYGKAYGYGQYGKEKGAKKKGKHAIENRK